MFGPDIVQYLVAAVFDKLLTTPHRVWLPQIVFTCMEYTNIPTDRYYKYYHWQSDSTTDSTDITTDRLNDITDTDR